jgi:NifU-like protein involved in Fe-S cluster formation
MLYTPQVLALATGLARWPLDDSFLLLASSRAPTCGSSLTVGIALSPDQSIARIGLRTHACAIGQAAAAIFAETAVGRIRDEIAATEAELRQWLAEGANRPDWPGLAAIDAARAYPARHGAILLAWKAALAALPSP